MTLVLGILAAVVAALVIWRVVHRRVAVPEHPPHSPSHEHGAQPGQAPVPDPGDPLFADVTKQAGLDFVHVMGARRRYYLPEQIGSGGAFLDYDGDGGLDLFLVQGGELLEPDPAYSCRLYRNEAGKRFVDVTEQTGTGVVRYGMGAAAGDYDNDGDVDIYVTCWGKNVLLRNRSGGQFVDVTSAAGVGDAGFGVSAAFLDYDRDGWLDLYVVNYVDWSVMHEQPCHDRRGLPDYCGPTTYKAPSRDVLYRNLGNGRFEDATFRAGVSEAMGNGLGVLCTDFDGDEWIDIFVANDQTPGFLWVNQGDGTFVDRGALSGCAYDGEGMAIAGMGVAAEDLDGDLDFDLLVTNIRDQAHLCLRNDGGFFDDVTYGMGFDGLSVPCTGFGVVLFDSDNDGELEAFVANGAVNRAGEPERQDDPYAERNQFLRRDRSGRFVEARAAAGPALEVVQTSRGALYGDYDNDGDVDILVTNNDGPVQLLRNDNRSGHSWLTVVTESRHGGRAALNAVIEIEAGGKRWIREVRPQESYLCSNDPRVHFGLGRATRVDRLTIRWPEGERESWTDLKVNRIVHLKQGAGSGGS